MTLLQLRSVLRIVFHHKMRLLLETVLYDYLLCSHAVTRPARIPAVAPISTVSTPNVGRNLHGTKIHNTCSDDTAAGY